MFSNQVFGKCLFDYHNGKEDAFVQVHAPEFEPDEIPASYLMRSFEELPEWEKLALGLCKGRILDIGAGSGIHSKILQDKFGLISFPLEFDPAAHRFQKEVMQLKDAIHADFWSFEIHESYDTLLLLMNGVGIAGKLSNLATFLNRCLSFLKPGGRILFESVDVSYLYEDDLPSDRYFGEMQYQVAYEDEVSAAFDWLYIDQETLKNIAVQQDWDLQIHWTGNEDNFLAQITKS